MANDKPQIDLVLSDLKKEVAEKRPEDFVLVLSGNKRVTFKYPLNFKRAERKAFLAEFEEAQRTGNEEPFLKRMLSDSDIAKYDAEDLDQDVHNAVMERIADHFGLTDEAEGKGNASNS